MESPPYTEEGTLLEQYGTPRLLWSVLEDIGYSEPPMYRWRHTQVYGTTGCMLLLHIPTLTVAPFWQEMTVEKEGLNEWEASQVSAFEILQKICQEHAEEMGRTPMCFFPPIDLNNETWCQRGIALIDEGQSSHNPTLVVTACANLAITKMYQARETSHKYWRQNFNLCNIELKVTNHLWEASKNTTNQVMDYAIQQEWEMNHQYATLWAQALAVEQQRAEAIERATDAEAA